ncbi:SDR family oxidoreductase [Sinirhodobacter populi]|uniref:SDR family oxidoreductase n=1 Tax=Paenirhodobacter populi TaxID=2306993 RepID=A0A443KQI7_9RHOB|nr:SDR family oxidoreductase [Sinirhodobacter populi]RWR35241.1 SDR family oxidoreductase [Sinirhodobacter populi]
MADTLYMVTGASGQLGRLVLAHLRTLVPEDRILGLVRREADAEELRAEGLGARIGDYEDAESLEAAFEGVGRLLLISGSAVGQRARQHRNVVDAAKARGVGFIAYTSILDAAHSGMALAAEHRLTEEMIRDAGIPHAFLRNGWYSENLLASLENDLKLGKHLGAAGEGKFSTAPRRDYAEAAAIVLSAEGHEGATYELAGDTAFTLTDLAKNIFAISGKNVIYVDMSEADYKEALVEVGVPEAFAGILADSDAWAAKGALYSESKDLSTLIGHPTEPIEETIRRALP